MFECIKCPTVTHVDSNEYTPNNMIEETMGP